MRDLTLEEALASIPVYNLYSMPTRQKVVASGVGVKTLEIIYESKDGEKVSYSASNVQDWEAFVNAGGTVDIRYTAIKDNSEDAFDQSIMVKHESRTGDVVGVIEVVDADTVKLHNFRKDTSLFSVDFGSSHYWTV